MRSIRHPLSGALYDLEANGSIRVTGHDGSTGFFRADGTYVSGDLYFADPHLCGWIGGTALKTPSPSPRATSARDKAQDRPRRKTFVGDPGNNPKNSK